MTSAAAPTRASAPASADPRREHDLRAAARHLAIHPLVLAENDPDSFLVVRRYEQELDQWFTQRFGYRLQLTADTARLFKSTVVARRRPLRTAADPGRRFSAREYTMLALALAAVAAGPSVISLRDLLHEIRSAATEAGVTVTEAAVDRRALVVALKWMIRHGAASEAHDRVDRYANDSEADAVLRIRPDRVALLPLPALARSETVEELLDRSEQRQSSPRRWMRSILFEEPVLYRSDLSDHEWTELRRRLGEESKIFDEMFGLQLEARAEGVAAIDSEEGMTDSRFPRSGTVAHAAMLLIDRLTDTESSSIPLTEATETVAALAMEYRRYWSHLADEPDRLTAAIVELLQDHRLIDVRGDTVQLLPAAWRYAAEVRIEQGSLL